MTAGRSLSFFADAPRAAIAPQAAKPLKASQHLHPCEAPGCDAWGAFGVGVFRGQLGRRFCTTHRALGAKMIGDCR